MESIKTLMRAWVVNAEDLFVLLDDAAFKLAWNLVLEARSLPY